MCFCKFWEVSKGFLLDGKSAIDYCCCWCDKEVVYCKEADDHHEEGESEGFPLLLYGC